MFYVNSIILKINIMNKHLNVCFKFLVFIVVIIIVFIAVIIIFNVYFTSFYVMHFELPLCMKCAINLPCLA